MIIYEKNAHEGYFCFKKMMVFQKFGLINELINTFTLIVCKDIVIIEKDQFKIIILSDGDLNPVFYFQGNYIYNNTAFIFFKN